VNSNGVLFGKGASVNVKGLVASTLDIKDADFNQDNFVFEGTGQGVGQVINQGNLKTAQGGYVALLGDQVINDGVIVAEKGTVSLNGAKKVTLNFNDDSLASVSLNEGSLKALVASNNAIIADGGQIILTTKAANELAESQVNAAGILRAQTLDGLSGKIEVFAYGGTAKIDGKLDASASKDGDGGFIETSGDYVKIAEIADITTKAAYGKTGTWLIDPVDFTIAKSGGDLTGAQVGVYLAGNNFIVESNKGKKEGNGDINVNDSITWSADTTLTLTADRNIYVNAPITASGPNSGLNLNYGGEYYILTPASFSGAEIDPTTGYPVAKKDTSGGVYGSITFGSNVGDGSLQINSQPYTLIHNLAEFQQIDEIDNGYYALATNLDFSGNAFPLGYVVKTLGANTELNGLGHVIDKLTIDKTEKVDKHDRVGLFYTLKADSLLQNIGLTNLNILTEHYIHDANSRADYTGSFAGQSFGILNNAYSSGNIQGEASVGGLIGYLVGGSIISSYSDIIIDTSLAETIGGLVALIDGKINIINSHYKGDIASSKATSIGGLITSQLGKKTNPSDKIQILNSYYIGSLSMTNTGQPCPIGGLVANLSFGDINIANNFTNVDIKGRADLGGLIGKLGISTHTFSNFIIDNCYSVSTIESLLDAGNILEIEGVGGFIGRIKEANTAKTLIIDIRNSHAIVDITSRARRTGGFIGLGGTVKISNCFVEGTVKQIGQATYTGGFLGSVVSITGTATSELHNSFSSVELSSNGASIGGLTGSGMPIIDNSYFNSDKSGVNVITGSGTTNAIEYNESFSANAALTNDQFTDIQYYLDKTIDDVLEKRALAKLEAEARAEARVIAAENRANAAAEAKIEADVQGVQDLLVKVKDDFQASEETIIAASHSVTTQSNQVQPGGVTVQLLSNVEANPVNVETSLGSFFSDAGDFSFNSNVAGITTDKTSYSLDGGSPAQSRSSSRSLSKNTEQPTGTSASVVESSGGSGSQYDEDDK
jgi:hypothetical protein